TGSPRQAILKGRAYEEYRWFKLGDALPGISMNADRAADRIIDAMVHGDADVTLSLPAKVAARTHALFPNLSLALNALATRFLPQPTHGPSPRVRGAAVETPATHTAPFKLADDAAVRNNE